jgi:flotillin
MSKICLPKVCVMKEPQMLEFASEQFVGKNQKDVEDIILQTIEGHFRAILGSWTNTNSQISLIL